MENRTLSHGYSKEKKIISEWNAPWWLPKWYQKGHYFRVSVYVEEPGKRAVSFTEIMQGPKSAFTIFFLQRLTSAVNKIVSDSEVRQILITFLAFENANSEYKSMIRPLKTRSEPIDEWIRNMADIDSHSYYATLIGEVISERSKKKIKMLGVLNCGKQFEKSFEKGL